MEGEGHQSRLDSNREAELPEEAVSTIDRKRSHGLNPNTSTQDQVAQVIVDHLRQQAEHAGIHKKAMDQEKIKKYVEELLSVSHPV